MCLIILLPESELHILGYFFHYLIGHNAEDLIGGMAFLLYDRALHNLLMLYRLVWQPKLHRMLGMH